jgi:hypothetical protein
VLASNDGTAGGAIQALSEEGIEGVLVTGQDAEVVALQRIAAGTQAMTIYKPLHTLAQGAAELALRLANGRPVIARPAVTTAPSTSLPCCSTSTVTRDNIVTTVVAEPGRLRRRLPRHLEAARHAPWTSLATRGLVKRLRGVTALGGVDFELTAESTRCAENGPVSRR